MKLKQRLAVAELAKLETAGKSRARGRGSFHTIGAAAELMTDFAENFTDLGESPQLKALSAELDKVANEIWALTEQ